MNSESLQAYNSDMLELRQSAIKTIFHYVEEHFQRLDHTEINEISPTETVIETNLENIQFGMRKDTKFILSGHFDAWDIHTPRLLDIAKNLVISQYAEKTLYPDFNRFMEVKADFLELAFKGSFDAILHLCNCKHNFNTSIAKYIKDKIPEAYLQDAENDWNPADYSITETDKFDIINLYAQYHGGSPNPRHGITTSTDQFIPDTLENRIKWIREALRKINIQYFGKRIAIPLIDSKTTGLDWIHFKEIVQETLLNCRVVMVHPNTKHLKKVHILHHVHGLFWRKTSISLEVAKNMKMTHIEPTLTLQDNAYFYAYES